jgi:hypothetical protein
MHALPSRTALRRPVHRVRGENATGAHADQPSSRYRICVRGRLNETIRSAFPALQARASDGDTVLTGPLPDRATLYGVLAQIEALGARAARSPQYGAERTAMYNHYSGAAALQSRPHSSCYARVREDASHLGIGTVMGAWGCVFISHNDALGEAYA